MRHLATKVQQLVDPNYKVARTQPLHPETPAPRPTRVPMTTATALLPAWSGQSPANPPILVASLAQAVAATTLRVLQVPQAQVAGQAALLVPPMNTMLQVQAVPRPLVAPPPGTAAWAGKHLEVGLGWAPGSFLLASNHSSSFHPASHPRPPHPSHAPKASLPCGQLPWWALPGAQGYPKTAGRGISGADLPKRRREEALAKVHRRGRCLPHHLVGPLPWENMLPP